MRYEIGTSPSILGRTERGGRSALGGGCWLLNPLLLTVPSHQGVEDRQHVAAVFHHAEEDIAQFWIAFRVAVPFCEDRGRHFDVAPELFGRVAAQKEAVEKSSFSLRESEVCGDFNGNELCHRAHKGKMQFTQKRLGVK